MERLTGTRNNFVWDNAINAFEHTVDSALDRCTLDFLKELREYRKLEEQGLLLRLPCKVGDTVYLINHSICENRKIPLKCVVDEFTFDHGNRCYAVLNGAMSFYALRRFKAVNIDQFGLTVFLTKEEAEAIMDERNGR